jgi:Non-histone chromosomal protein MC1.
MLILIFGHNNADSGPIGCFSNTAVNQKVDPLPTSLSKPILLPKGAPAWMPDKIWKPKVKKVGIEKLDLLFCQPIKLVG